MVILKKEVEMKENRKSKEDVNDKIHEAFSGKDMKERKAGERPERQGPDTTAVKKSGHNYEPDKDHSGTQGGYGQGNRINKGSEGAQGYGKYEQ